MAKQKSQIDKFREAAREADESEDTFNATLRNLAKSPRETGKVCPECHHVFQGNGWDGIDAHWKARHETIMPYDEAWPLIKAGNYPKGDQ
jgi:hypothetical protein